MSVSKFSVILSATLFVVFQLGASPLTLEAPSSVIYQQTLQAPCIFGDPSCHNPAGFDYVVFPPGGSRDFARQLYFLLNQ